MNDAASSLQAGPATAYLQQLQALAAEVHTAIRAITANDLPQLEASVSRQEMMAAGLAVLAKQAGAWTEAAGVDRDLARKIRLANAALRALSLEYAALLRYSGRSLALLTALCRGHQGQFMETRGHRLSDPTWSCVM